MWQMQEVLFLAKSLGFHVIWRRDVLRWEAGDDGHIRAVFAEHADTTVRKGQAVVVQTADYTKTVAKFICWKGSNDGSGEAILDAEEPTQFTRRLLLNRLGMLTLT